MELPEFTRASTLLRITCGLWLVGSAMAAGLMLRSPWIILPLGLVFSVLFVIGKWKAWTQTMQSMGWKSLPLGIVSEIPPQLLVVALFYGPCLGFMKLAKGDRGIAPLGAFDAQFSLLVLLVGAAMGLGAHFLEQRAEPQNDTPPG